MPVAPSGPSPSYEPHVAPAAQAARRRALVVEDHPLFRDALVASLRRVVAVEIVYAGASFAQAAAVAAPDGVGCAILDLRLGDGCEPVTSTAALVRAGCSVLVVSALADPVSVNDVLAAGALGYVSKHADTTELEAAIIATFAGERYMSREVAAAMTTRRDVTLSERERTALALYASGLKLESVARRMGISTSSVKEYLARVRTKYAAEGVPLRDRTDLYRAAEDRGLVT